MISKNLYVQLFLRVLLIVALSLATGACFFGKHWTIPSVFLLILIILVMRNLTNYLNQINLRLFYFFDAIRNEDSMLSFPEQSNDKMNIELNKRLNLVNRQIQGIKIENKRQEQYFQALLEHAATGILTIDENGFILHCNSAVKKHFAIDVLTHLNQLKRINLKLYQTLKNIKPSEQKLIAIPTEHGSTQLSIKASSFISNSHELLLLSVQDIKNELDEKELDSWLKLIRVLMHEIMNSITPITSISESLSHIFTIDGRAAMQKEIDEKEIQTTIRGLNVIKEQGSGLISFVESYRKLSRLPNPDKKIFRIIDLVNRISELYHSLPNSNRVTLSVFVNPKNLEVFGDENLISQVLLNLIKNALESNENNSDGKIQLSVSRSTDNHTEICVSDNGPGISPEIIDQIFVPFFTTRDNGSGIGLSLSKQITRLHGGTLQVRSIPNKETVFTLAI